MKFNDVVIKGTVKEKAGSYDLDGMPYTDYIMTVEQVVYGKVGSKEITVVQHGGNHKFMGFDKKEHKEVVEYEKHPLFKSGETYLLFLRYMKDNDKYLISTGGYGTFKLKSGKAISNYPELTKNEQDLIQKVVSYKK